MSKKPVFIIILVMVASILTVNTSLQSVQAQVRITQGQGSHKKSVAVKPAPMPAPNTLPYTPGDVKAIVKPGENPVLKIGLAGSGVTVVEFPATDRFFAVHPPQNGSWVVVENSPSLKTDHHLVLRAGKDLIKVRGASASLSVQMRSGLVITIWLYPVTTVWSQTQRLVVSYNREDIVKARRQAGLAVNLGESEVEEMCEEASHQGAPLAEKKPTDNVSSPQGQPSATSSPVGQNTEKDTQPQDAPRTGPQPTTKPQPSAVAQIQDKESEKRQRELQIMLGNAAVYPKSFKNWSRETNGLTVATRMVDLDADVQAALVAIHNVKSDEALRIMADQPELVIQTLDDKDKVIQLERVKKLAEASTTTSNMIPAKATIYYAIAFVPPILGKQQRLRVSVGQRKAADDPAIANLSAKN